MSVHQALLPGYPPFWRCHAIVVPDERFSLLKYFVGSRIFTLMNDLRFPRGHAEDVLETYVKACGQCAYEPDLRDSPNARAGRSTSYDPCRTKSPFRKTREVSGLLQTNRPDCSLPVHCERVFPVDAQAPLRCHLVSLQSPLTSQVFLQQASVRPAPCVSRRFVPQKARRAPWSTPRLVAAYVGKTPYA